jgi:pre-mRNA-splicing factor ISY1
MARNAEKAMTTLARWRAAQQDGEKPVQERKRRPFLASECDNLADAERFRLDIIRQISKRVTQIQNAGLGEFRLRDLNDQINRFLREKRHWEQRIVELGGAHYGKSAAQFDRDGREVPGNRGYKYFGAAKDLPGVRDLFAQTAPPLPRKTRAELMQHIGLDYYGYRDEDDGVIVPLEMAAQKKAVAAASAGTVTDQEIDLLCGQGVVQPVALDPDDADDFMVARRFPAVPTIAELRTELLNRKKQQLLQQLIPSDDTMQT